MKIVSRRKIVLTRRWPKIIWFPYAGQELGCDFYLTLFDYDGEQYFLLNNNCIDQVFYPFNCDGTILCEDSLTEECERFYTEAKLIGVVGIGVQ